MTTTEEKIKVMQAYKDGKEIEVYYRSTGTWCTVEHPTWDWSCFDYRIAPEQQNNKPDSNYVPYDSVADVDKDKWVVNRHTEEMYRIAAIDVRDDTILLSGNCWVCMGELFRKFTYEDGTLCGKKVSE